jgi:lipoprotein-releasing system permease protein
MPFEWIVAVRFLREGRMQTLLIIGGATVGVAVIIFLTSLITGLQANLVARTLGTQAHIVVRPAEDKAQPQLDRSRGDISARVEARAQRLRSIDQWERLLPSLRTMPDVVAASSMVSGPAFAVRGTATKSVVLMGIEPDQFLKIVKLDEQMVAGQFRVTGTDAVIGTTLANDLGVAVGDKLRLTSAESREDIVTITGIFDIGNTELNRRWVFIPQRLAQNLLDLAGGISSIDITVRDIFRAEEIALRIEGQTGLLVESWMRTNAQLLTALRSQTLTNQLIRGFVVLIVALGIASVLVVTVVQKSKEIGILRAMGTSPRRVMAIFLMQGGLVALIGSVLGSIMGIGLVHIFARVYKNADGTPIFRPEVSLWLMASACLVAVAVGLVAAVAPARRAARMDPVQAIRYG